MLFLADIMDFVLIVGFITLFIWQVAWPVLSDQPTFPMFRKKKSAPVISIVPEIPPDRDDRDSEGGHNGTAA